MPVLVTMRVNVHDFEGTKQAAAMTIISRRRTRS